MSPPGGAQHEGPQVGHPIEVGETQQIFFKPKRQETEDYITGRFG